MRLFKIFAAKYWDMTAEHDTDGIVIRRIIAIRLGVIHSQVDGLMCKCFFFISICSDLHLSNSSTTDAEEIERMNESVMCMIE